MAEDGADEIAMPVEIHSIANETLDTVRSRDGHQALDSTLR